MKFCSYCIIAFILCLSSLGQAKYIESGVASIYSVKTNGGTRTASGIPLRDSDLTAAHKTLPIGTRVRVECPRTKKSVVVKITDRGPYVKGRVIDLTPRAAQSIGLNWKKGLTKVVLYKHHNNIKQSKKINNNPSLAIKKTDAIKVKPALGAPFVDNTTTNTAEIVKKKNNNTVWGVAIVVLLLFLGFKLKKRLTNRKNVI